MRKPAIPPEFDVSDFWRSVYQVSEQHRRLPAELRALAGVSTQPFHPPKARRADG